MPVTGGSADKIGNRYELRWTVFQFAALLRGEIDSIRLEPIGDDGDGIEFWVEIEGTRSFHQVKRQNAARGHWTISNLRSRSVLRSMIDKLRGTQSTFTFVSVDSVENIRELSERAQQAGSSEEFLSAFQTSKPLRLAIRDLCKDWQLPEHEIHGVLRRISVETISENSMSKLVEAYLSSLIDSDPQTAYDVLASFALDNVHRELTSHDLWIHLTRRGFRPNNWSQNPSILNAVGDTTDSYLRSARADAIGGVTVRRVEAQEIVDSLSRFGEDASTLTFVSGKAGVGKSGVVAQVVEEMRDKGWPVLAFRLDRLPLCYSMKEVGARCGLPGDPAEVLDAVGQHGDCLLVIDQLDAVSRVSGRNSEMFDCVRDIVEKAVRFPQMRVLVACRAFDLGHDSRFRSWTRNVGARSVEVQLFSEVVVRDILSDRGYSPEQFGVREVTLLRLPLHLAMFVDIVSPAAEQMPSLTGTIQLFDEYWKLKQQVIRERQSDVAWANVLDTMCDYMSENAILSVPDHLLDEVPLAHVQAMVSENVLVQDGHRYAFFHESFFDYVFARRFDTRGSNVVELLLDHGQQLFRRAQVRQILTFQRERNWACYRETLRRLLFDSSIRLHIKQVVVAWLASLDDPHQEEWEILKPHVLEENELFGWGIWRPWYHSASWFRLLDEAGIVAQWLNSENDHLTNNALTIIANVQQHEWDRVAGLLDPFVGLSDQWNAAIRRVVRRSTSDATDRHFDLIARLVDEGLFDDDGSWDSDFWSLIHHLVANATGVCDLIRRFLKRGLAAEMVRGATPYGDWDDATRNRQPPDYPILQKMSKDAPLDFVQAVLPYILGMAELYVMPTCSTLRRDRYWDVHYHDDLIGPYDRGPLVKVLTSALALVAKRFPKEFEAIADGSSPESSVLSSKRSFSTGRRGGRLL